MPSHKPFLVVSDVHLGAVPHTTEESFRRFLRFTRREASGLLINGDLFDVWLASRHFVVRDHVRVLSAIADVVEAGVPVYFVGGNHDALEFGGAVLRDDLGVVLLEEPARITLANWEALVIHGDGAESDAPEYRKRHPIFRSLPFRWSLQRVAHLDRIYDWVAGRSATRRTIEDAARAESAGRKPFVPIIERWARRALQVLPEVQVVMAGHSHQPTLIEVKPGRYYVNSGDWITNMTYVVLRPNTPPALLRWPERVIHVTDSDGGPMPREQVQTS